MQFKHISGCLLFAILACSPSKSIVQTTTTSYSVPPPPPLPDAPKPLQVKNIIFMIGDGMGLTQITAGMISNGYKLNLEQFKSIGLHKSYSFNNLITDSAAGATAFSIGRKTFNGAIGVGQDTMPYLTILQQASQRGMVTGLVATSTIVHATPAAFIAHNWSRNDYEGIATEFLSGHLDCFIGGGKKYFTRRKDEVDLYQSLRNKGYQISDYLDGEISNINIISNKFGFLTADGDPLPVSQGRDYLSDASMKAIQHLDKQNKGFFLMIEGSQIDWGGHANNANYVVTEMLDFDKTIGRVLEWVKQNGNTLLIVTADHETGGLSINEGTTMDSLVTKFTTDKHTATLIPVFAYGPGEELFRGIYENTAIYQKMKAAYGWPSGPSTKLSLK